MKKLSWKKVGCLLLALLMAATMLATGAMAYDNAADQTGSITIHKFEAAPTKNLYAAFSRPEWT